jgi:hypothetical protein
MTNRVNRIPFPFRQRMTEKDTIQCRFGHFVNFPEVGTIEKVGVIKIRNIDANAD